MDFKKFCIHCMHEKTSVGGKCPHCGNENESYAQNPEHLAPTTPLNGKYLLGKALGQGGFGITYIALDTHLQVPVAIKELYLKNICRRQPDHTVSIAANDQYIFEENRKRFLQEARVLAMFNEKDSEGIVNVRDHFEENGTAYIVMEYLDGITLRQYVKGKGKLSFEESKAIIDSVGHALMKIHEFGVIHKDVGPDNIMVIKGNQVKLLDFGGATNMHKKDSDELISFKRGYAPPEQYVQNGRIGPWTDIYALAATMYFCLTGVKPPDAMERKAGTELKLPSKMGVKISSKMEAVLMTAMEMMPSKRYHTVEDFFNAMSSQSKKPNKILWAVLGVVAVIAVALIFALGGGSDKPEIDPTEEQASSSVVDENVPEETEPPYQIGDTIPVTMGTYLFESYVDPGIVVGIDSGFADDGAHLILKYNEAVNRNRIMVTPHDGFYNFQAGHTGSFLQAWTQELGTPIVQGLQAMDTGTEKWVFVYCGEEDGRIVVSLKNAAGSVMAPKDGIVEAGNDVVLAEWNPDDDTQKWYMTWSERNPDDPFLPVYYEGDLVETITDNAYTIASALDGKTMCSVSSYSELAETELIVWETVWDETQWFFFELLEESRYRIYPAWQPDGTRKCLEYDEATGRVLLRDVSDNNNQLFRVVYTGYNMYLIQAYNESVLGFEIAEDGSINGNAVEVKPYEEFTDNRQMKWLLNAAK